jgi:hypothetical protein
LALPSSSSFSVSSSSTEEEKEESSCGTSKDGCSNRVDRSTNKSLGKRILFAELLLTLSLESKGLSNESKENNLQNGNPVRMKRK